MREKFKILIPFLFIVLYMAMLNSLSASTDQSDISTINIQQAIDSGYLEYEVHGAYNPGFIREVVDNNGVHYGKCMLIYLESKLDSMIMLKLECGTELIPLDSSYQKMIVTRTVSFPLFPNGNYLARFYAMCGQLYKSAPHRKIRYYIGDLADPNTVRLASYLSENHIQNMAGQHALWAYTDNAEFTKLLNYGADENSIMLTKTILREVGLTTPLTPAKIAVKNAPKEEIEEVFTAEETAHEEVLLPMQEETLPEEQIRIEEVVLPEETITGDHTVSVNKYALYTSGGFTLLLIGAISYLLIRRRSNDNTA